MLRSETRVMTMVSLYNSAGCGDGLGKGGTCDALSTLAKPQRLHKEEPNPDLRPSARVTFTMDHNAIICL